MFTQFHFGTALYHSLSLHQRRTIPQFQPLLSKQFLTDVSCRAERLHPLLLLLLRSYASVCSLLPPDKKNKKITMSKLKEAEMKKINRKGEECISASFPTTRASQKKNQHKRRFHPHTTKGDFEWSVCAVQDARPGSESSSISVSK